MTRWREYFLTLVIAVALALIVRSYFVTAYRVPTGSMQPTLKPGDFIFSSRVSYGVRLPFMNQISTTLPERGDLVVFTYSNQPDTSYVKRVVALPGDRVQITDGRLIVNESVLEYEKLDEVAAQNDNPNSEIFDVYLEKMAGHEHRVIFQKSAEKKSFGPLVVPPGEVFLLGDNRDASDDSRYWGTVPTEQIVGKVVLIWLSLDWQSKWGGDRYPSVRWNRVFSSVD